MARRYWLLKSDPRDFGLHDLKKSPGQMTRWDGVRNYQARNLLRDEVKVGDGVLFYHSRSNPPAVVATARVVRSGYPDPTQFDRRSNYHDPKASRAEPRWYAVDIRLDRELAREVTLPEMRKVPGLDGMVLLNRSRLSVQPVTPAEWKTVLRLAADLK
jgi:predicted RNA-binding protein with PUA-like domain